MKLLGSGMLFIGLIFLVIGITKLVALDATPQQGCTIELLQNRTIILEKNLELQRLTSELTLLKYTIKNIQDLTEQQKQDLIALRSFITSVGGPEGDPTL